MKRYKKYKAPYRCIWTHRIAGKTLPEIGATSCMVPCNRYPPFKCYRWHPCMWHRQAEEELAEKRKNVVD